MTTYISLLRGINVSGKKLIKMDALRKSFELAGCSSVRSYLQSGNVVFTSKDTEANSLEKRLSQQIKKDFDFEVPVIVITVEKLKQIIDNNPFLKDPIMDPAFFHVSFLSSKAVNPDYKAIEDKKQNGEVIFFSESAVYIYCPEGYGMTKLNNNFLENKLKVGVTTRNWKTTNEVFRLAQNPI